jgi:uncharacterized protein YhfF
MGLVLLINSEKSTRDMAEESFLRWKPKGYSVKMISKADRALESLNFDLPEVVIINCNDPAMLFQDIVGEVKKDAWLHSFGIVGLYDSEMQNEREIAEVFGRLNLLVLLDKARVISHLAKSVSIILENKQLIFQRELSTHLADVSSGSFELENDVLAVPIYSGIAVTNLVQQGNFSPDRKYNLQLALSELLINGIEHGNCGISYEEKNEMLNEGYSVVDIINEKCKDPAIAARRVHFEWENSSSVSTFTIRDEGEGFDVSKIRQSIKTQDKMRPHGRGIRMAEIFSRSLRYNEKGNQVVLTVEHEKHAQKETPEGFARDEVIFPKAGDVVIQEGERSDSLYYISSGHFSVFHNGKKVGILSSADVFMGEMSFLLNHRRSASVVAEDSGKLIRISRKSFVQAMKNYPHYGIFLSKLLAQKLARSNVQLTALSAG